MDFEQLVELFKSNPAKLRALLEAQKVSAKAYDKGIPLLSKAIEGEHLELAKMLVELGADVNAYAKRPAAQRGMAPIHFAGSVKAIELLHQSGANIDAPYQLVSHAWGMVGETALHTAVLQGRGKSSLELAEALAKAGADIHRPFADKEFSYGSDSVVADADRIVRKGRTIVGEMANLRVAVGRSDRTLEAGSELQLDPLEPVMGKYAALEHAFDKQPSSEYDLVDGFAAGANELDDQIRGMPLLSRAILRDRLDIAEMLIETGADVNAYAGPGADPSVRGKAPIHFVTSDLAVEMLAKAGANVDAPYQLINRAHGMIGETALHTAVLGFPDEWPISRRDELAIADALIEAGADKNLPFSPREFNYEKEPPAPGAAMVKRAGMTIEDRLADLRAEVEQAVDTDRRDGLDAVEAAPRQTQTPAPLSQDLLDHLEREAKLKALDERLLDIIDNYPGSTTNPQVQAPSKDGESSGVKPVPHDRVAKEAIENLIVHGFEQELESDQTVDLAAQKKSMQRLQNIEQERKEGSSVEADQAEQEARKEPASQDNSRAVPDAVTKKFLKVDDRYYFPDETPAFEDGGEKLHARAEHKEVVSALVAIAVARDWDKITVKGTEVFRRAVWMEAAQRGIEVRGYKPNDIEKARLSKLLDKEQSQATGNTVEKGFTREAARQLDQTSHKAASNSERIDGAPLKAFVGKLLEHGSAHYNFDKDESMSYFVKLETASGEKTVWGKDLARAVKNSQAQIGEKVTLEYMGNMPVTVTANVRDAQGAVVGKEEVGSHRNTWNMQRSEAFLKKDPETALAQHPDLAPAVGALVAAEKFAEAKFKNPQTAERFVEATRQTLASNIAAGKELPNTRLVKERRQEVSHEQDKKAPEKARGIEQVR